MDGTIDRKVEIKEREREKERDRQKRSNISPPDKPEHIEPNNSTGT